MEGKVWTSLKGMEAKWRPNLSSGGFFSKFKLKTCYYRVSYSTIGCPSSTIGCLVLL